MEQFILQELISILDSKRKQGHVTVKKVYFMPILENTLAQKYPNFDFTKKWLPRGIIIEAAKHFNASYIVAKNGRSRIKF